MAHSHNTPSQQLDNKMKKKRGAILIQRVIVCIRHLWNSELICRTICHKNNKNLQQITDLYECK